MSLDKMFPGITGDQIMQGNEDAWIDMLLEDEKILEELGLSLNLSPEMKQQVKEMILRDINNFMMDIPNYQEIEMDFDETKSPAEQFISEAMEAIGIRPEIKVSTDELIPGNEYTIYFPNGNKAEVYLERILPNSFGDDYVFKNIHGAESLTGKSRSHLIGKDEFPLPKQLLSQTKLTKKI